MTTTTYNGWKAWFVFNEDRREQGFTSQAHLDAFLAYHDHTLACPTCQQPGEPMPLDDGLQPTLQRCAKAEDLFDRVWAIEQQEA